MILGTQNAETMPSLALRAPEGCLVSCIQWNEFRRARQTRRIHDVGDETGHGLDPNDRGLGADAGGAGLIKTGLVQNRSRRHLIAAQKGSPVLGFLAFPLYFF